VAWQLGCDLLCNDFGFVASDFYDLLERIGGRIKNWAQKKGNFS